MTEVTRVLVLVALAGGDILAAQNAFNQHYRNLETNDPAFLLSYSSIILFSFDARHYTRQYAPRG